MTTTLEPASPEVTEPPIAEAPASANLEPFSIREIAAVLLWVLVADVTLYRAVGFAGPAVFYVAAAAILWLGRRRGRLHPSWKLVAALLACVSLRLACCGSLWLLVIGSVLLLAFAMALAGAVPLVLEVIAFTGQVIVGAGRRLSAVHVPQSLRTVNRSSHGGHAALLFPLAAVAVFGSLFVLANPDLLSLVSERMQAMAQAAFDWVFTFSPLEMAFWAVAGWLGLGLMRPAGPLALIGPSVEADAPTTSGQPAPLYAAIRNMLVSVIALFAMYLVFEFSTLWFRQFPAGFYYAGYAHQGALWLTIALALATATLSFALGQTTSRDPRRSLLIRLAWIWSIENFLLAAAVYNRLAIYVGYNGMTRMRIIGIFGVTAVVIGFLLVIYKITQSRSFWWLVRAQLLALALVIIAHSIFPVDYVVHRYNVARVMKGDLRPAVQIAVKPMDTTGFLTLFPLLEHDDPIIRSGIQAMLRQQRRRLEGIDSTARHRRTSSTGNTTGLHWSEYQWAQDQLVTKLQSEPLTQSTGITVERLREIDRAAIEQLIQYTMPWY